MLKKILNLFILLALNILTSCGGQIESINKDLPKANSLTWIQGYISNSTSITATWQKSTSKKLSNQKIIFFENENCTTQYLSPINIGPNAESFTFDFTPNKSFSFKIISIDNTGKSSTSECSNLIEVDTIPPQNASSLSWLETSPQKNTTINSNWTSSTSSDIANQQIQFFTNSSCTNSASSLIALDKTDNAYEFTGSEGTYYYKITTYDLAGNSSSACSSGMTIDTTAPSNATSLGWDQTNPYKYTSITARWARSTSSDISSQRIQFFTDSTCTTSASALFNVTSSRNYYNFTGEAQNTYYYRITTIDYATNSTLSSCSSPMHIDTIPPENATELTWLEESPVNDINITARWTLSTSSDVANQNIRFFSNSTCTIPETPSINLGSPSLNSYTFSGKPGIIYYYTVTTIDFAANQNTSNCSPAMEISACEFNGWINAAATGPVRNHSPFNEQISQASITIEWKPFDFNYIDSYNIYRSTSFTDTETLVGNTTSLKFTDYDLTEGSDYSEVGQFYYYNIRPVSNSIEIIPNNPGLDSKIKLIVPPANMVFINRWIANKDMCEELGRPIDRNSTYSCAYSGPGNINGRFDIGANYFLDRWEAGGSVTETANAPGQSPWVNISSTDAQTVCQSTSIKLSGSFYSKNLMSRKLQLAASVWDQNHIDSIIPASNIDGVEDGTATGACNSNSAILPTASVNTENCISKYYAQDLVGNVREWLSDQINDGIGTNGLAGNEDWTGLNFIANGSGSSNLFEVFPSILPIYGIPLALDSTIDGKILSFDSHGDYYSIDTTLTRGAIGGGANNDGSKAGRLNLSLSETPSYVDSVTGFRCAVEVPTPTASFEGWENLKAIGPKRDEFNMTVDGETANINLRWHNMTFSFGNAEGYRVYRSTTQGELGSSIGITVHNSIFDRSVTEGTTFFETGETYYYQVVPLYDGVEIIPSNTKTDTQIEAIVPSANMVLVHRWITNQNICDEMSREIDRNNNYVCSYIGPGNSSNFYDLEEHYFLDRWEATGTGSQSCLPGLAVILEGDPNVAYSNCQNSYITYKGIDYFKTLMSRKLQIAASSWDPEHINNLNTTIADIEKGASESFCNSSFSINANAVVTSDSVLTRNCKSRYGAQDMVGNLTELLSDNQQNGFGNTGFDPNNTDLLGFDFVSEGATGTGVSPDGGSSTCSDGTGFSYCSQNINIFEKLLVPLGIPLSATSTLDGSVLTSTLEIDADLYQFQSDGGPHSMAAGGSIFGTGSGRYALSTPLHVSSSVGFVGYRCTVSVPE